MQCSGSGLGAGRSGIASTDSDGSSVNYRPCRVAAVSHRHRRRCSCLHRACASADVLRAAVSQPASGTASARRVCYAVLVAAAACRASGAARCNAVALAGFDAQADRVSPAHGLGRQLSQLQARSSPLRAPITTEMVVICVEPALCRCGMRYMYWLAAASERPARCCCALTDRRRRCLKAAHAVDQP